MNLQRLSRARLADLISDEFVSYYGARDTEYPRRFWLPGLDPYSYEDPAGAISALYAQLTGNARARLKQALIDLAGRRAEWLPVEAVEQLLLAAGRMHAAEMLLPLVRVLGMRRDLGDQRHLMYATAVQVALGFGPQEAAWDAANELTGYQDFPPNLVFDVFEVRLADPRVQWSYWFLQLEPLMVRTTSFSRLPYVQSRFKRAAEVMARMSIELLRAGLQKLLGPEGLEVDVADLRRRTDPHEMLAAALFALPESPLRVTDAGDGRRELQWRDRATPGIVPPDVTEGGPEQVPLSPSIAGIRIEEPALP